MNIAVIGTGNIGMTLGRALSRAGHRVTFGSRHPTEDASGETGVTVADVAGALEGAEAVVVAIPGAAVEAFAADNGAALAGTLIVDASNRMGAPEANSRAAFESRAPGARYARAFNCVGVEVLQDPVFGDVVADLFFSCGAADRSTVEGIVGDVGLRPVYVGEDPAIVDGAFRLWIALAMGQHRGRGLALRTLERPARPGGGA